MTLINGCQNLSSPSLAEMLNNGTIFVLMVRFAAHSSLLLNLIVILL